MKKVEAAERITVIEICHRKSMNAYSLKDDPTNLSKSPSQGC